MALDFSMYQKDQDVPPQPKAPSTTGLDFSMYERPEQEPDAIPEEFLPPEAPSFETPEDAEYQQKVTFQELAADEDYMDMLREYQENRFGESAKQGENETNVEYIQKFLSQTREFEWNSIDLGRQLDWVRGADEEQRMKFGYLYSQLDRLPDFYEEGGTGTASAVRDIGKSLLLDPLNYIGFGATKVAGFAATRGIVQILKSGVSTRTKVASSAPPIFTIRSATAR